MLSKSQSCDRCIRQGRAFLTTNEVQQKTIKKPESYLAKKFEQLYDEDRKLRDKKKNKIEQIIKQRQQKQVQGCTFKPQINNNPQYYVNNDSFLKRQEAWKKNLDMKLEEKRQQKNKKQVETFTFQPKITDLSLINSQIKSTNTLNYTYNYSKKHILTDRNSYKVLHGQRKKFKQIAKATIVQPFKHRRMNSNAQKNTIDMSNHQNDSHNTQQSKLQTPLKGIASKMQKTKKINSQVSNNLTNNINSQKTKQKIAEIQNKNDEDYKDVLNQETQDKMVNIYNINQIQNPNVNLEDQIYEAEGEEQGESFEIQEKKVYQKY